MQEDFLYTTLRLERDMRRRRGQPCQKVSQERLIENAPGCQDDSPPFLHFDYIVDYIAV